MKRSSNKKLRLSRTTIQRLDLANVAGAAQNTYTLCTTTTINTIGNCPSATCTVLQGCTLWPCITVGTYDC